MAIVQITPVNEKNICNTGEVAIAEFSIANTAGQPFSFGIQVKSQDDVSEWITIEGPIERRIQEGLDTTVSIKIAPPVDLISEGDSAKVYSFRIRVYNVNQTEEIADSPTVTVTVNPATAGSSKPFPWLWVAAAVPVLAIVAFLIMSLQSPAPAGEQYTFAGAAQISNHPSGFGAAKNAIDGNTDGKWQNSQSNTLSGTSGKADYQWWQGDLGESREIGQVVLHFRTDCCDRWNKDFHIFVADQQISGAALNLISAKGQAQEHVNYLTREPSDKYTWKAPANTRGRYLMVMTTPEAKKEFNAEMAGIESQINTLNNEVTGVNNQISQIQNEMVAAAKKIADAQKQLSSIATQTDSYQKTLSNLEDKVPSLESDIKKGEAQINEINAAIAAHHASIQAVLKAQLAPKINQIQLELKLLISAREEVLRQIDDTKRRIVALEQDKASNEKQIADSEAQLIKLKEDQVALETQQKTLEQKGTALAKEKANYDNEAANSFLSLAEVEVFGP